MNEKSSLMLFKVKPGDRFTVKACYFHVPDWMDDQPCVILSPVLFYDESNGADSTIDDFLGTLVSDGEFMPHAEEEVTESLEWVGRTLTGLRRAVNKALREDSSPYKSVYREVMIMDVEITECDDGELDWVEHSRKKIY